MPKVAKRKRARAQRGGSTLAGVGQFIKDNRLVSGSLGAIGLVKGNPLLSVVGGVAAQNGYGNLAKVLRMKGGSMSHIVSGHSDTSHRTNRGPQKGGMIIRDMGMREGRDYNVRHPMFGGNWKRALTQAVSLPLNVLGGGLLGANAGLGASFGSIIGAGRRKRRVKK